MCVRICMCVLVYGYVCAHIYIYITVIPACVNSPRIIARHRLPCMQYSLRSASDVVAWLSRVLSFLPRGSPPWLSPAAALHMWPHTHTPAWVTESQRGGNFAKHSFYEEKGDAVFFVVFCPFACVCLSFNFVSGVVFDQSTRFERNAVRQTRKKRPLKSIRGTNEAI